MFLMTSGLCSVRDKSLTYFEEVLEEEGTRFDMVLNASAAQVRRVATEDKEAIRESGLDFNLYSIVG